MVQALSACVCARVSPNICPSLRLFPSHMWTSCQISSPQPTFFFSLKMGEICLACIFWSFGSSSHKSFQGLCSHPLLGHLVSNFLEACWISVVTSCGSLASLSSFSELHLFNKWPKLIITRFRAHHCVNTHTRSHRFFATKLLLIIAVTWTCLLPSSVFLQQLVWIACMYNLIYLCISKKLTFLFYIYCMSWNVSISLCICIFLLF